VVSIAEVFDDCRLESGLKVGLRSNEYNREAMRRIGIAGNEIKPFRSRLQRGGLSLVEHQNNPNRTAAELRHYETESLLPAQIPDAEVQWSCISDADFLREVDSDGWGHVKEVMKN
jgi:hypothetical protein